MFNNNFIKSISQRGFFALLALMIAISVQAQGIQVKGLILDENNIPLIGATVMVKGNSGKGAVADLDGNFTLSVNKGDIIVVSYIGYKTQELKAVSGQRMEIKLIPDSQALEEVVVVGYGAMKRSDLTGSVSSIAAKDLEDFKTSSVMEALGGQVAGVQITQSDGTPDRKSVV